MSRLRQNAPPEYCTTNQLEFLKNTVMKAMMQHRHSLPFRNSSEGQEGNMDLATIKAKLEMGKYCSANECIDDLKLMFSDYCKHIQSDDTIVEKAHSLEKFLEAKLAMMPQEEQEMEETNRKKQVKEISGLQDYMSSYFTPQQSRRSRRRTQPYEVEPLHKSVQPQKRKSGEGSSGKRGKKKVFVQSSSPRGFQGNSPRGFQVGITKAHISRQLKEMELVRRVHEKGEVKKVDEEVEEINEYIVEEVETDGKVEDEVIDVETGEWQFWE